VPRAYFLPAPSRLQMIARLIDRRPGRRRHLILATARLLDERAAKIWLVHPADTKYSASSGCITPRRASPAPIYGMGERFDAHCARRLVTTRPSTPIRGLRIHRDAGLASPRRDASLRPTLCISCPAGWNEPIFPHARRAQPRRKYLCPGAPRAVDEPRPSSSPWKHHRAAKYRRRRHCPISCARAGKTSSSPPSRRYACGEKCGRSCSPIRMISTRGPSMLPRAARYRASDSARPRARLGRFQRFTTATMRIKRRRGMEDRSRR